MNSEQLFAHPDCVPRLYDGALSPDEVVQVALHSERLFPTHLVKAGGKPSSLPKTNKAHVTDFRLTLADKVYDLNDIIALNRIGGLLIMQNGQVLHESYHLGHSQQSRWMSMSMAKTVTATLVGVALKQGQIQSLQQALIDYLPQLQGSPYAQVSLESLLTMSSGVAWHEEYTDPNSDRRAMLRLQLAKEPGSIVRYLASLPSAPSKQWNYSTGETHLLGAVLRAAIKQPLADYLSEHIWQPMGAEQDATWWLESPDGLEVGGSGLAACLRDYARFGQFLMTDRGQTLPTNWLAEASKPLQINHLSHDYGYMLWRMPSTNPFAQQHELQRHAVLARGIFGQHLYLNPAQGLVIAINAAQTKPRFMAGVDETAVLTGLSEHVQKSHLTG
jgi:CubicO group peptidase (beta-lactamase class C family)